ncbi:lupus La-like protein [Leptotrombidium deliense]|uniref:Lupus La-like protein n=1 Tax=Leptotrombidium deliense TaxID=299467 RepID=A0A443SKD7_9ACAR|nr:lupus La-like protein [Leptotrombidium deliense]
MGTPNTENGVASDISDKEAKIIKQIEYYFSDINLGKDKFMQQEMMKNNGWIPLSVLLTFNRLKAITESEEEIVTALRKSKSGLMLISENERQVKRDVEKIPLPEMTDDYRKQLNMRTVHLKGFPLDAQYDDIHGYCSQFGEVESLEVRRTKDKQFKGCVFAVYKTVEEAEKAVASDEKFKENGLLRENKLRYFERKSEFFAKREQKKKAQKQTSEAIESKFVANAVLKIKNVPKDVGFAKLKDVLGKYGEISYVDIDEETSEKRGAEDASNEVSSKQIKVESE